MKQITLTMTEDQAEASLKACELLMRLSMGQFEHIADLAREGVLVKRNEDGSAQEISLDEVDEIQDGLMSIKKILGHNESSSFGIRNEGVPLEGKRAYEMWKALQNALSASHGYPQPLSMKESITGEPEPKATFVLY